MNERSTVECDVETLVIRVPMKFKKRGGRKEIIVPDGLSGARPQKPRTQEPLLTALARAFHWQELILVEEAIPCRGASVPFEPGPLAVLPRPRKFRAYVPQSRRADASRETEQNKNAL